MKRDFEISSIVKIHASKNNKNILSNILGTFIFKSISVLLNVIALPLYLKYFNNNEVVGIWFTIINVLNWILTFDLGIGNGLRNQLTLALSKKDLKKAKELISSSYIILGVVVMFGGVLFYFTVDYIDWNKFFNISTELLTEKALIQCISITMTGILCSFFLRLVIAINYALQKSALNNLIGALTSIFTYIYLLLISPSDSIVTNFRVLSIFQAIVVNVPLLLLTIYAFTTEELKKARPSIYYYNTASGLSVLSLGIVFLLIQLLYMVITVTNEWFISHYYNPSYCVDYQIYYKLFSLVSMIFMLALSPIWSAVTKAFAEGRYTWILKLQKILYIGVIIVTIVQVLMIPLMPWILKIWLGKRAIPIHYHIVWIFVLFSALFTWVAVQSIIVSGIGKLKIQLGGYVFAAIFKIIAILCLYKYFDWSLVILVTCIGLVPYAIIQPIWTNRFIKNLSKQNVNTR